MNFIKQYKKYGDTPSSHDFIKFLALVLMVTDHVGYYFFPQDMVWRAFGRMCVPIWFFLAGYAKPSNKFPKEIIVLAVLLVIVDVIFKFSVFSLNVLFTILVCRFFVDKILQDKKFDNNFEFTTYVALMALFYIPSVLLFEYGTMAILFALWGGVCRQNQNKKRSLILACICFVMFVIFEITYMPFNIYEIIIMVVGVFGVMFMLQNFKTQYYERYKNNFLSKFIMFFGRNTLYMYFIHVTLFVILSYFMFIEKHKEFSWF